MPDDPEEEEDEDEVDLDVRRRRREEAKDGICPRFHHKCVAAPVVRFADPSSAKSKARSGQWWIPPRLTGAPDGLAFRDRDQAHAIIFTIINDPPRQSLESQAGPAIGGRRQREQQAQNLPLGM